MTNPEQREKIARALAAVERLANTTMDISLEDWSQVSNDILAAISSMLDKVLLARDALEAAIVWHEAADKAISKQPPTADGRWRRMEHQEQVTALREALAAIIALDSAPESAIPAGMVAWHGGEDAPADWNGGPVFIRGGWEIPSRRVSNWSHHKRSGDITAYTPRPAPDVEAITPADVGSVLAWAVTGQSVYGTGLLRPIIARICRATLARSSGS